MALIELTSAVIHRPIVINTDYIVTYYVQEGANNGPDVTRINMTAQAVGSSSYVLVTEDLDQVEALLRRVEELVYRFRAP